MAYQLCNGIRTYYEVHGAGEPLVLISGLGGDHFFWESSLATLSARYQVVIYDARGTGQTDAPEAAYSMETLADDLAALMDGLNIGRAHLLGFSMGGNIALTLAIRRPDKVASLIVAASHAVMSAQIRLYMDAVLGVYEKSRSMKELFSLVAPWLFSTTFLEAPGGEAYLEYDENEPYPQSFHAWKMQYLAQRAYDVRAELPAISARTLILGGTEDLFATRTDAAILHNGISGSVLQLIEGAGHLFNFERPDQFHGHVLNFLAR